MRSSYGYNDAFRLKKQRQFLYKIYFFIFSMIAALGIVVYVLFFANIFDIRAVDIQGPDTISHSELQTAIDDWLESRVFGIHRRDNLFLVSNSSLYGLLTKHFNKLDDLKIIKTSNHRLLISYDDRKPVGIWCLEIEAKCFYFDKEGIAYAESLLSSGAIYTTINDKRERNLQLGDNVTDKEFLSKILEAKNDLRDSQIGIKDFIITKDSFDEFDVTTNEGWKIFFIKDNDIKSQVLALKNLLETRLNANQRKQLDYVDLRINDRIYYR